MLFNITINEEIPIIQSWTLKDDLRTYYLYEMIAVGEWLSYRAEHVF